MPFIPAPEFTYRVTMEYEWQSGDAVVNVFHVSSAAALGELGMAGVAGEFADWWDVGGGATTNPRAYQSEQLNLANIHVHDVTEEDGEFYDSGSQGVGNVVGETLPYQIAAVLSWRTSRSGRSFRGRTYLGGLVEAANDNGVILEATRGFLEQCGTDLINRLQGNDTPLVIASYRSNGADRAEAVTTEVRTCLVNAIWDNQRRRTRGVGD